MKEGAEARHYLRRHHHGALSTISKQLAGWPFGSLVPFVLDHAARPVLLISRLAEHTKNIDADPRVSLLVHEPTADAQAAARLTLSGILHGITPCRKQCSYTKYARVLCCLFSPA